MSGRLLCAFLAIASGLALPGEIAATRPPSAQEKAQSAPETLVLSLQDGIAKGDTSSEQRILAALKTYPGDGGLYNLLGIVRAQQQRFSEAETDFRRAVSLRPDLAGAHQNLARLYEQSGASAKALPHYRRVLALSPSNTEARLRLAALLHSNGDYLHSQQELSRLASPLQQSADGLSLRCGNLAALGRMTEAGAMAQMLISAPDLSEEHILDILPAIEKARGHALSRQLLEGAIARNIATVESRKVLGAVYEAQGELGLARKTYENIARDNSRAPDPLLDLARVAYRQHQREDALGYLAHARDLQPQNPAIHFFFGMICVEMNLPAEARKSLARAVELSPDEPYYRYALGAVTLQGFDPREAVAQFEDYSRRKPADPRGRFALGVAYFQAGQMEEAERELRSVADGSEAAAGANYYLGRIARTNGNFEEAVRLFGAAARLAPKEADPHAELGLSYLRLGRPELARQEIELAIQLNPDSRIANRNLLVLYQQTKDARAGTQRERVAALEQKRDAAVPMLLRTLEARPYP